MSTSTPGTEGTASTSSGSGSEDTTGLDSSSEGGSESTTGELDDALTIVPCRFAITEELEEGTDYECGDLRVPQRRTDLDGTQIQVHFVRFFGPADANSATIYLDGGPGGDAQSFAGLPAFGIEAFTEQRDLVVLAQRGTFFAIPPLLCSESEGTMLEQLAACREGLAADGVEFDAYTTPENADDIEDLRRELGYEEWNLLGVSYGTRLALEVIRRHPDSVRAAAIDGVVPSSVNWDAESRIHFWAAVEGLAEACAADMACDANYGAFDQAVLDMITSLDADPIVIKDGGVTVEITGAIAAGLVGRMMYVTSLYPVLPLMVTSLRDKELAPISGILEAFFGGAESTLATGMHWSVKCSDLFNPEIGPGIDAILTTAEAPAPIESLARTEHQEVSAICDAWPKPAPVPSASLPVESGIPVLLSSGAFDPITPPSYASIAGETLSNARSVVFANSGHGALTESECSQTIAMAFLNDPQESVVGLDTSCAQSITIEFAMAAEQFVDETPEALRQRIRRQLREIH